MFYLYVLFSEKAQRHYIGHAENPEERLAQHNTNPDEKYTGKFSDWKMVALFEAAPTKEETVSIEKFIKKQKGKKLLLKLIDPQFVPTGSLASLKRIVKES